MPPRRNPVREGREGISNDNNVNQQDVLNRMLDILQQQQQAMQQQQQTHTEQMG